MSGVSMHGITDSLGLTNYAGKEQQERYKEGLQTQAAYADEANRLQQEMNQKALDASKAGAQASLISQFGLAGIQDYINRQLANAQQQQNLPTATARLAALQAFPIMQKMAGMKAYAMPSSVTTTDYLSGMPDYQGVLSAALSALNGSGDSAAPSDMVVRNMAYGGVPAVPASSAGGLATTNTALTEVNPDYNYQESPLYQFQKAEAEKNMGRALRARGLYGSETGAKIAAEEQNKLAATEAEKQWNRIQDIVNIGLGGGASSGGSSSTPNLTSGISGLTSNVGQTLNESANERSNLYQKMGESGASNLGQLGTLYGSINAAGYTPSNSGSLFNTLVKAYGLYRGLGGGTDAFSSAWGKGFSL